MAERPKKIPRTVLRFLVPILLPEKSEKNPEKKTEKRNTGKQKHATEPRRQKAAKNMYHICSNCGKHDVVLKCDCLKATYYCDAVCQKAHSAEHRHECSNNLLDQIHETQERLDACTATDTGAQPCDIVEMQQALAILHSSIGRIMGASQQPRIKIDAILHCYEALLFHTKVRSFCNTAAGSTFICAGGIVTSPTVKDGFYDTMQHLSDAYRFNQQYDEAFEMLTKLVGELRAHISHDTSPRLVARLGLILMAQANVRIQQHHETKQYNTSVTNDEHCHVAIGLLQEATSLWRFISCEANLAHSLLYLATAFNNLGKFVRSDFVVQESLTLARKCPQYLIHVEACNMQIARNCLSEAQQLRDNVFAHRMFMLSGSMAFYHQPLQIVRIGGLLKKPKYNGFEAVVTHVGPLWLTVCLQDWRYKDKLRNIKPENVQPFLRTAAELRTTFQKIQGGRDEDKLLKIKPENAQPFIRTAAELQTTFTKIQQLTAAQIKSSARSHKIQLNLTGEKHINAAISCYTLATACMKTYRPQDMREALVLLKKAESIRRKIGDEHVERSQVFPAIIGEAEEALLDFSRPDCLSPVPCCWSASSREQDKEDMRKFFTTLQARHNNRTHMPSNEMLHSLHLYGITGVAPPGANTVDQSEFANIACNALQKMKHNANTNDSAQSALPNSTC